MEMKCKNKKQTLLPIGTVAKGYGVSDNCIRRMESAGLLSPAYISPDSGYRYYDSSNISRIGTILDLRSFGFVNEDIMAHFNHSTDYSVLYKKLLYRQAELNRLVDRMSRLVKDEKICHCEITEYEASYYYIKKSRFAPTLGSLSELTDCIKYEAIKSGLPFNYNRSILINTDCLNYKKFKVEHEQVFTICLPLREPAEGPDIIYIPTVKAVSMAWALPGLDYFDIIHIIDNLFKTKDLTQAGTLRASYDLGGHMGDESTLEETIMHILVPIN